MAFKEISIEELSFNPFTKIGKEWMLITSGNEQAYNTMTASWGFMGVMWNKNVVAAVVRPSRHTFGYMEKNELFTLSFFDEEQRDALRFCGSHSGRDCDKAKETGLTPMFLENTTSFKQANMVIICRKLYAQDMDEKFLSDEKLKALCGDDMHKAFIGEIVKVLIRE